MKAGLGLILTLAVARPAAADVSGHDRIRAHVATLRPDALQPASHLAFSLRALVPIYGTYTLETRVFGSVRPTGVVVDWIVGGVVPAGLAIAALADAHDREALAVTALGLYVATRLGILVVGNLHVRAYNQAIALRLAPSGLSIAF